MKFLIAFFVLKACLCLGLHQAYLLPGPLMSAQVRFESALNTRNRFLQSSYILRESQESGLLNLAVLRNLARENKEVYLLLDGFSAGHRLSNSMMQFLVCEGVKLGIYNPLEFKKLFLNARRLHDKLQIVDGEELITGDRNIGDEYFGLEAVPWESLDIYVKSREIAEKAEDYFFKLFYSHSVERVRASSLSQKEHRAINTKLDLAYVRGLERFKKYTNTQRSWRSDLITVAKADFLHYPLKRLRSSSEKRAEKIISFLALAKNSVEIITPYFVPPPVLKKTISDLVKKNVLVKVVTNSWKSNNQKLPAGHLWANLPEYANMGIEIWQYEGPSTLHAKGLVVDNSQIALGSFNADYISFKKNSEVGVVIEDPLFVSQAQKSAIQLISGHTRKIVGDGQILVPYQKPSLLTRCFYRLLESHL